MINIKKAGLKEVNELESISKKAHKEISGWVFENKNRFKKIINSKDSEIYTAIIDDKIVGYLHCEYVESKRRLWIEDIYVIKDFRGKKIAKTLISVAVRKYRKIKPSIALLTADRNLSIFNKLGFKKTMNYMEYN